MPESITSNGGGADSYNLVSQCQNCLNEWLYRCVWRRITEWFKSQMSPHKQLKSKCKRYSGWLEKSKSSDSTLPCKQTWNIVLYCLETKLCLVRRELASPTQLRICFVKYIDSKDVPVALHLSNTVFIDRALNVSIYCSSMGRIRLYSFTISNLCL